MGILVGIFLVLIIIGLAIFFGVSKSLEDNKEEVRKLKEEVHQLLHEQEKLKRERKD